MTFICSLGPGYDQGVFSGIVGNGDFLEVVHHPSPGLLGIIVSIYNLGCFTGTIVSFITGDLLGPRRSMWFAMGWIIVSLSQRDSGQTLTVSGRSNAADNRILASPAPGSALRYRDRDRYRDDRRAGVSV